MSLVTVKPSNITKCVEKNQDGVEAAEAVALLAEHNGGPGSRADSNEGVAINSHKNAKYDRAS